MKRLALTVLVVSLLVFGLLGAVAAVGAAEEPLLFSGKIAAVDKYGNVMTDISPEMVAASGAEVGDVVIVKIGDNVIVLPFVTTYGDVDRGTALMRPRDTGIQLAINYGNFAVTYGVSEGSQVSIYMKEKGAYLSDIAIRHLEKLEKRDDYDSDEAFANFRQVTAGKIKPGVLYRVSHPSLGDDRSSYAAKLVEEHGIKTILNLSDTSEEFEQNLAHSEYYRELNEAGNVVAVGMGVDFAAKEFTAKLKTVMEFMIAHDGPYAVHCVEGKDRVGIVVALLEGLAGATVDEIVQDYMVSYENYFKVEKGTEGYKLVSKIMYDQLKEMNNGQPVTDADVKAVVVNYLKNSVGLDDEQIKELEIKLVGEASACAEEVLLAA
ncbi:MAG TPA: protein tyrosine phosphatase [Firmicutes bacterium]|nr:protein tyrosine phosphatase [Bacillota bacterium]